MENHDHVTKQSELNSLLISHARNGNIDGVSELLMRGVDPDVMSEGNSAIGVAAEFGHFKVVQKLIENGADVNWKNSRNGWTSLMHASRNGHESVVKLLIGAGADIDARDNDGMTSLIHAIQNVHESVVKPLGV
jgi:ankyrin repeat protein